MSTQLEHITELNQNFNDLGEDLVLLESVLQAGREETDFPDEYVSSSLTRINDYIRQHTEAINQLAEYLRAAPKGFSRTHR